jgi:hypothetical protein
MQQTDTLQACRAKLCVPKGSLERNKTLSITALRSNELPDLPVGLVNVTDSAAGFRFLPHGEHFKKLAAKVVIPFDTALIPAGYTTKDIHTYFYDEVHKQWTALTTDTIEAGDGLALAYTTHFTDMINGIIKVPESPETQGYAPNAITDIKAANPATGIMAMAPPFATQSGAVSLSYPFTIPAGRKGIEPSVALQYNSEGQTGWVGLGWSLFIPTIDIDTRWGVPLFDSEVETESYLVMGEQLTEQPYRTPDVTRETNKQFYPRVEGGFSKIIRYGSSPENYCWEVTDKSGTIYSFGGSGGVVAEGAVVRNSNNDIVQWALVETRNVYDDYVSYTYDLVDGMLYPAEVSYTGHGDEEGLYRVEFHRLATDEITRQDKTTTGRLGFLQYDNQQLNTVEVYYDGELLRSYQLNYEEGVFGKNLLTGVTEKDSEGNDFNTHTFEYYNDVENGLYGDEQTWDVGDDSSLKDLFTDTDGFISDLSAINGSYSSGKNYGGGVTIGVGYGVATVSGGIILEYSKNSSEGKNTLTDINGDGLPDKVFISNDNLWYRANTSNLGSGTVTFGDPIQVNGINHFSCGESSSSSRNINTGIGVNITGSSTFGIGAGASFDTGNSTEKTKVYFSDFNGDGLVDIANNGTVYFNYIGTDGCPNFVTSSALTPNPISGTDLSVLDATFTPDYEAERDSLEFEYPLQDVVRVWRAPYTGQVTITGSVELTASAIEWQDYDGSPDGIVASVQQENTLLWKDSILTVGTILNPQLVNISVDAGDRLLFRLQSRYSGALDEVSWSPEIRYDAILADVDSVDEHLSNRYIYNAQNDFIFSGRPNIVLAQSGGVMVDMPYDKDVTSDDITLVVTTTSALTNTTTELYRKTLAAKSVVSDSTASLTFTVAENDTIQLSFGIESNGQTNWEAINWTPKVQYTEGDGTVFYAAPEMNMFNKLFNPSKADALATDSVVTADGDTTFLAPIKLIPYLEMNYQDSEITSDSVSFALRDSSSMILFSSQSVNGSILEGDTLVLDSRYEGRELFASFYASVELSKVKSAGVKVYREKVMTVIEFASDPNDTLSLIEVQTVDTVMVLCMDLQASVHSVYNTLELGHLYRGWGQFGWEGSADDLIDVDDLAYDDDKYSALDEDNIGDEDEVENILGDGEPMYTMSFIPEMGYYQSLTEDVHINGLLQASARIGSLEIVVDSIDFPTDGSGLAAPVQKSQSTTKTTSAFGSIAGANGSYSNSKTTNQSELSIIDLNGDRYPDWIMSSGGKVKTQYTSSIGTLSDLTQIHGFEMTQSSGEANSISGGFGTGGSKVLGGVYKVKGPNGEGRKAVAGCKENTGGTSLSGNYAYNEDESSNDWVDVNGDGLPDMVYNDGRVLFNTGYGFADGSDYGHSAVNENTSNTIGGGRGVSIGIAGYANISYGVSYSSNTTVNDFQLIDINGDGLPDMIKDGQIAYNMGTGYLPFASWEDGMMTKSRSSSMGINGNIAYPIMFPVFIFTVTITPSIVCAVTAGVSRTLQQIMDVNGDGFPDLVESEGNDELTVRINQMGRTNLLKTVNRPYGATMTMDYADVGNTYDLPQSKTVLASLEVNTNMPENGATRMKTVFEYEDGYYDRYDRYFFGFGTVKTTQLDTENDDEPYRTVTQTSITVRFLQKIIY